MVVKASDRDVVLNEISARMARYEKLDPETYKELKALRQDVKDVFNQGLHPGDEMIDALYWLDPKTREFVEKMSANYDRVVTPDDFTRIGFIMSDHLQVQVPVLKSFTKYFGRLAEDYINHAKPKHAAFDYSEGLQTALYGEYYSGKRLPKWLSQIMGIKDESIREKFLRRIPGWVPQGDLDKLMFGIRASETRRTGTKIGKYSLFSEDITKGVEIGYPNKLPKSWSNVPWVNFDGKTIEQNFTQVFEEKLAYKDAEGKWVNNILQIQQKTDPTWWEEFRNKDGKINNIADTGKARTAFAVNG
jgi:hypothetical protein